MDTSEALPLPAAALPLTAAPATEPAAVAPAPGTPPAAAAHVEAPTGVRYQVLGFLGAMTFILYLDRVCIGQAATAIQAELGLDNTMMSLLNVAFLVSYGFFEVPTGRLGDRHGSRTVLTRIVLWWSLFTALTGAAFAFWMLLVVRFLFGAGEAGALPNAARVLRRWFPESGRGVAQGVVTTAMMVGGAVAPLTAAFLIQQVGWRWTFAAFGGVGVLWALAFHWWFRDNPEEHPSVNRAEADLLSHGRQEAHGASAHPSIPWRLVLTSPNVWLMGALMNCGASMFYMLIFWFPAYLEKARGVDDKVWAGLLASTVLAGGALGCVCGGFLTDYLLRRTGSQRLARCMLASAAFGAGSLSLLTGLLCETPEATALFTALTCFCLQLQVPAWWATTTRISGVHVGALFGLMNSLGVAGPSLTQLFMGGLVDWLGAEGYTGRDQWDPALYVFVALLLVGCVLWQFVNPNRPVAERAA